MEKEMFEFSNRVELSLANIKTIKEAIDVLENEYKNDVKRFLKYIENNLKNEFADIRSWETEVGDIEIYFYPKEWKVLNDDDEIAIAIFFNKKPYKSNPFVGLYVPVEWPKCEIFNDKLNKALTKDFMDDWGEQRNDYQISKSLEYENYSNGDSFDTKGFCNKIIKLINEIVKIKPTIDKILNEI
ncbi:MAG: hypothetical protein MIO93_13075 [ANME-2 cluster archaeon]|jgi:hypothetical protein|nr:hypothetical protein [ANME-2 cluster archaeon]